MKNPFLRDLLRTNSIYISSNITFENLDPLSTYLGKPGNPDKGGISFADYLERQEQHREAEIAALHDVPMFVKKARDIYGYQHFICDSGGSLCEVVDVRDDQGPRHAQPRRPHPPALHPRAHPNMPTSWSSGSATSPSRCTTSPPS